MVIATGIQFGTLKTLGAEMERELTEGETKMFERFPLMFRAVRYPAEYRCSLGSWGLETGPGWYPIVETAATAIELELQAMLASVATERLLVAADMLAMERLPDAMAPHEDQPLLPYVVQVKEKLGTLVIYMRSGQLSYQHPEGWERIMNAVKVAEATSESTCETCGQPGKLRKQGGWWRTRCWACEKAVQG